ncbi:MAG TPA: aminomethyltransferase family protein [Candidatus Binatia bacterium]
MERHRARGAELVEEGGWILPARFGAPLDEYAAVRSAAGLFDLCDHAVVRLTGPDRVSFLQGMVSNDVKKLAPGHGLYAAVLDVNGKVLADLRVLADDESFILLLREPLKRKVIDHLNRYLVADDVEIEDPDGRYGVVSLQGPHALLWLGAAAPRQDPPLHMYDHRMLRVGGRAVRAVRSTHTGEEGFDLLTEVGDLAAVVEELERAGAPLSARWAGFEAGEILRIEAGLPRYGVDMDEDTLLLETGLDHAVSFQKGCYLGQEVIERVHSRGHVNKKLAGLMLDGKSPARRGDRISAGDREIGRITSSVFSPKINRVIALGYLQRDHLEPAMEVAVRLDGAEVGGVVTALPFVYETTP